MDCADTALVEKKRDEWKALGLTAPSVNKVLTTLSAIFDKQIALRTIRFNPVTLAERMARGCNEVGENDEIDIDALEVRPEEVYGPDQLLKLIQSAEPGFAQTILTTFPLTGVRHGEALALMWRDIDFEQSEITIRRNWSGLYRDGEPVFSTPKTKHSFRKLRNPGELSLALKKWKLQCPPSKWDLVFPRADGRPQDRKTTWRAFDAAIKKANENAREDQKLRRLTVHSLRHSFASIHLMNGTPIPEVSAMLGHANVNITLTVYTHFIPKMQTDSSSRLAAVIFSGNKPDGDQVNHLKTARTI
jgi:integrase